MLNKPAGYVSAQAEHGHIPAIDLLTPENQWQERGLGKVNKVDPLWETKLAVIGRLDINSTGLLLFSQDGVLARRVIGENSEVEKEYVVGVRKPDSGLEHKLDRLRSGLSIEGRKLRDAEVTVIPAPSAPPSMPAIQLRMVLLEGMKRQIRRMCDAVGLKVLWLRRVRDFLFICCL